MHAQNLLGYLDLPQSGKNTDLLKSWAIETRIFERYVQAAGAPLKILVSKSHHFSEVYA
jgi:hypothetical protein